MRTDPQGAQLLRAIGGNPLTVIIAMMLLGGRGTESDVTSLTYPVIKSEKTVRMALRVLHKNNLVVRESPRGAWILTQGGRQMALGWTMSLGDGARPALPVGDKSVEKMGGDVDNLELSGNFYRPGTVNLVNNNESKTPNREELVVNPAGNFYRSLRDRLERIVDPKGGKLFGPLVHKLASRPGMTIDYIDRHVKQWEEDPNPQRRLIAMLATKLEAGDKAPLTDDEQRSADFEKTLDTWAEWRGMTRADYDRWREEENDGAL